MTGRHYLGQKLQSQILEGTGRTVPELQKIEISGFLQRTDLLCVKTGTVRILHTASDIDIVKV